MNCKIAKSINSTFIALIPKIKGVATFKDFKPRSMVGWLYKLLSKVLTNRFKRVLHSLVGETQATFLGGRQILDGILITNELIDGWKRDGN